MLLDLDLIRGGVASYFDLRPRYTIADVMDSAEKLDRQLLDNALTVHQRQRPVASWPGRNCPRTRSASPSRRAAPAEHRLARLRLRRDRLGDEHRPAVRRPPSRPPTST